ncbi:hypothetical protein Ppb6_01210 [Photorhabdus australis subsp. thailandensis]|uniref:Uncharacterized protein n=1 Tax=Photorhabdus australis subsp. thailandensis TaxID=2805096 RepID=A0A1C0U6M9_9GAMM|nr:hypothetical protein [Photorhabdus australis]OCQ53584.1 hypothetical protein Ppb6_01210 [Photorhabdus australis subsp. thailandensis]
MRNKIYKLIRKIPVMGSIFRIVNAYAYEGDDEGNKRLAPLNMWWNRIFKKMVYLLFFVEALFLINNKTMPNWSWEPSDTIFSVFPSILGFGIGVFALMFVMPNSFLKLLTEGKKNKKINFGPEIVPVDMGYPLVAFVLVMAWAAINKIFPCQLFKFISTWAFFYGLAMTFELISFLFNSSYMIQKISSKTDNKE